MDFTLSDEQQALTDTLARYCAREYDAAARRAALHAGPSGDRRHWQSFAMLGLHGAGVAESAGGFDGGMIENSLIMQAFGRALVLEPFLSSSILAVQTLAALPPGAERDELLSGAISGKTILALAHTEADGRGDLDHIATSATRLAGGWRLTGHKSLVSGAPLADHLLVSARTEQGISLFLVNPETIKESLTRYRTLDNLAAADLRLEDSPAECMLAPPDHALRAVNCGFGHALVGVCAEAVGAMEAVIEMTVDYVRTREQFGATLNTFQAVQHRLADMLVELELSRSILYQGIALNDAAEPDRTRAMSAMKAVVSTAALFVGRHAVQLHGAMGITEESMISHYYRRLFVISHQFGGESHHLERLARCSSGFWNELASEAG